MFQSLVESGVSVNAADEFGRKPLHFAALNGALHSLDAEF